MVKFLYCDDLQTIQEPENKITNCQYEFETSLKRIIKIYNLSDYFQIEALNEFCILKIYELIDLDNVDQIFYFATQHNIQVLIETCQWFYDQNYEKFKNNEPLKNFLKEEETQGVEKYIYTHQLNISYFKGKEDTNWLKCLGTFNMRYIVC
ncbi:ankyrin repeat and btb/poz domain-containing protein 2-like protein [Anaeramoeba flamelloides]|uniref:Ankyrin repeat and btb/poz domain-containing protein 2-like protein n=1 Tax=Anaeramoeba flamelloides TaxID=1746091 RepID=A0AAV7Y489_9EUKA|nr:ankyrin repeat and btb/poz domain-containing protein 2-like protein [Anaeramoeba flamelloides]